MFGCDNVIMVRHSLSIIRRLDGESLIASRSIYSTGGAWIFLSQRERGVGCGWVKPSNTGEVVVESSFDRGRANAVLIKWAA